MGKKKPKKSSPSKSSKSSNSSPPTKSASPPPPVPPVCSDEADLPSPVFEEASDPHHGPVAGMDACPPRVTQDLTPTTAAPTDVKTVITDASVDPSSDKEEAVQSLTEMRSAAPLARSLQLIPIDMEALPGVGPPVKIAKDTSLSSDVVVANAVAKDASLSSLLADLKELSPVVASERVIANEAGVVQVAPANTNPPQVAQAKEKQNEAAKDTWCDRAKGVKQLSKKGEAFTLPSGEACIKIPNSVIEKNRKSWEPFVLGQFYSDPPTQGTLHNIVNGIWSKHYRDIAVSKMEGFSFLFRIPNAATRNRVIN